MAPRPSWKGYLRLSLVSCPVRLYIATSRTERISFHLLDPATHNRIQMRPIDPETGKEVPRDQLERGYEFEKGRYVVITPAELDELRIESSNTIDLQRFVDEEEVDPVFFDAPYYLAPEGKMGSETFGVILAAMRREKKVGIARVVLSNRERAVVLMPRDVGLMLVTLRAADEVRAAKSYFEDIEPGDVDKEMIDLATRIIRQKTGKFDPAEFTEDRYQAALHELVDRKIRGEKPVVPKAAKPGNVVNLMDALRRSLDAGGRKEPAPSRRREAHPTRKAGAAEGKRRKS